MSSNRSNAEYWLVAVPNEVNPHETWEQLNNATWKFSTNTRFHVPDLRVGKLDDLFTLNEQLEELDHSTELLVQKIAKYFSTVLDDEHGKLVDNLVVGNKDVHSYISRFHWATARYPIKLPVKTIKDNIAKQMEQIERNLKVKSTEYNAIKEKLKNIDRNSRGSLLFRDISDLVSMDDFVLGSEYLQTLMVVVPKMYEKEWHVTYASYSNFVVPFSSRFIHEEGDYCLYSVTLFEKVIDTFKACCKKDNFTVRDFVYDEEQLQAGRNARDCLLQQKQKCYVPLVRWLKVIFGEAIAALMHIKALRVFNESVLRFGLPVNFLAAVMEPKDGEKRRLQAELYQLYKHLDSTSCCSLTENLIDIPDKRALKSMGVGDDYQPYVFFKVNLDF